MGNQIQDRQQIVNFVNGGKAVFTLVSKRTETRYTYKVEKSRKGDISFVKVMYGSDNVANYSYVGTYGSHGYRHGAKSKLSSTDSRSQAISWFLGKVFDGGSLDRVEFWHEGRCACCGRRLTVPLSIATGIGPECAKRHG